MKELTHREMDVLRLLTTGQGQKRVAKSLGLSLRTVETHCRKIYLKLGVENQVQAACWAVRNEIDVDPGDPTGRDGEYSE